MYKRQKHTLEVPAGKLEKGEDPYTCGLRELEEESGPVSYTHLMLITAFFGSFTFSTEPG